MIFLSPGLSALLVAFVAVPPAQPQDLRRRSSTSSSSNALLLRDGSVCRISSSMASPSPSARGLVRTELGDTGGPDNNDAPPGLEAKATTSPALPTTTLATGSDGAAAATSRSACVVVVARRQRIDEGQRQGQGKEPPLHPMSSSTSPTQAAAAPDAAARLLASRLGLPLVELDEGVTAMTSYRHVLRYVPWTTTPTATTITNKASPSPSPSSDCEYALEVRSVSPLGRSKTKRGSARAPTTNVLEAAAAADGCGDGAPPHRLAMVVDWVQLLHGQGGGGGGIDEARKSPQAATTTSRPGKDRLVQAVLGGGRKQQQQKEGGVGSDTGTGDFTIVDLTAGWGTDALTLLKAGPTGTCRVTLVERDPIVLALLRDAHRRLAKYEAARATTAAAATGRPSYSSRIAIVEGDGVEVAARILAQQPAAALPDAVYLDPMFPPRTKSAAVKKPMQVLHSLLQTHNKPAATAANEDSPPSPSSSQEGRDPLLEAALRLAKRRVVVKRPAKAEPIGNRAPAYALTGGAHRWDVYLC